MKRKILVGNWKMNKTIEETIEFIKDVNQKAIDVEKEEVIVGIAPSFICLPVLRKLGTGIITFAQNVHFEDNGAFTGEVSPLMLKEIGVNASLIGHSERRNIFGETDDDIRRKVSSCIENGITPILCVGEHKHDRENGEAEDVINRQLHEALDGLNLDSIIIAYEPVWAIGTGLIPTFEDIMSMHHYIKNTVKDNINNVSVLYGGSVNEKNIVDICNIDGVDCVLIGGASNNAENLLKMYNLVK